MPVNAPVSYRDASQVTLRPVVPGPIFQPIPPDALTSGSQINRYTVGAEENAPPGAFDSGSQLNRARIGAPWPGIIDGATKFFNSWRPNVLRDVEHHNTIANYGSVTSLANFGFKASQYGPDNDYGQGSIGLYPGPVPSALRPMWNNLVAIVWGLRVNNPTSGGSLNDTIQASYTTTTTASPVEFVPSGTASLTYKGASV